MAKDRDDDNNHKHRNHEAKTALAETPEPQTITPGTWPSPIDGFRQAVAGVALVGLIPTGDEKTPYPTGTPCPPGSRFWLREGYYKSATPT